MLNRLLPVELRARIVNCVGWDMYYMYSLSIWAFAHSTSHTPTKALVGGGGAGHSRDGSSRGKRAPYDRPRAHSHTLAGFFLLPILKCFIFLYFFFLFYLFLYIYFSM